MTLRTIALCNLKRRKAKAAFVLVGLLVGISSVVAFVSLVDALTMDINHKLEKYGANILVLPKMENLSLTYGGLSLGGFSFDMQEIRQKDLQKIETIENAGNVAAVGPMVLGPLQIRGRNVLLAGVDFEVSSYLRPWWNVQGELPMGQGVLAGSEAARILGIRQGDRFGINDRELLVTGILEPTGSQDDQILFASLTLAQSILGKEGRISMAEVAALCAGCPIEEMVRQISGVLPGAKVMAIKQVVEGRMETLSHLRKVVYGLSGLVMAVGALVVLVTMMGSVRERTSEFGIFRAIGYKKSQMMQIVLFEASIISVLAGVLGYILGLGGTRLAIPFFTESHHVPLHFDPMLAGGVLALALVLGLVSSTYPALQAARMDPNEALRAL